jgi:ABC-type arginine/histidine transport system permease subunit
MADIPGMDMAGIQAMDSVVSEAMDMADILVTVLAVSEVTEVTQDTSEVSITTIMDIMDIGNKVVPHEKSLSALFCLIPSFFVGIVEVIKPRSDLYLHYIVLNNKG